MNFEQTVQDILAKVAKKGVAILGTSAKDIPTLRPVSIVVYDNKVAFQTSYNLLKFKQMEQNQHIALNIDNIQINGTAVIDNRQALEVHPFIDLFKEKHTSSFQTYSHMKSNRVIELIPESITVWGYKDKEPYRTFINMKTKTVIEEKYQHSEND